MRQSVLGLTALMVACSNAPGGTDGGAGVASVLKDLTRVEPCSGLLPQLQNITVSNTGTASFMYSAVLTLGATSPFTLTGASASVAAGAQQTLTVTPKAIPATVAQLTRRLRRHGHDHHRRCSATPRTR